MAELLIAAGVSAGTAATIASIATTASVVAGVAGAGIGTYSAIRQQQQGAALQKSAAQAADIQAQSAKEAATYSETQFRRKAAFLAGQQEADYAASGVDISSGSPMLQELDTARQSELEAQNIRRTGDVQSSMFRYEAGLKRFQGANLQQAIPYTGLTGLTQGASSILGYWTRGSSRSPYGSYGYL